MTTYTAAAASMRELCAFRECSEEARRAILMIVGTLYRNRETVISGTIVSEMKGVLVGLLDPITIWEFA